MISTSQNTMNNITRHIPKDLKHLIIKRRARLVSLFFANSGQKDDVARAKAKRKVAAYCASFRPRPMTKIDGTQVEPSAYVVQERARRLSFGLSQLIKEEERTARAIKERAKQVSLQKAREEQARKEDEARTAAMYEIERVLESGELAGQGCIKGREDQSHQAQKKVNKVAHEGRLIEAKSQFEARIYGQETAEVFVDVLESDELRKVAPSYRQRHGSHIVIVRSLSRNEGYSVVVHAGRATACTCPHYNFRLNSQKGRAAQVSRRCKHHSIAELCDQWWNACGLVMSLGYAEFEITQRWYKILTSEPTGRNRVVNAMKRFIGAVKKAQTHKEQTRVAS